MKLVAFLLFLTIAVCYGAEMRTKRGLHLHFGSSKHHYIHSSPVVVHHAPVVTAVHHTPVVTHHVVSPAVVHHVHDPVVHHVYHG